MAKRRDTKSAAKAKSPRNRTGLSRTRANTRRQVPPSELGFRALLQGAPDAIFVVDNQRRFLHANRAALRLTGFSWAEIKRMKVGELAVPEERDRSLADYQRLLQTGRVLCDRQILRKDGSRTLVEFHTVRVRRGVFLAILRDVAGRSETEMELRKALDAYGTLVDLCHAGVISAGVDGRIQSWNKGAEALLGYTADEAVGKEIARLVPRALRDRVSESFREIAVGNGTSRLQRTVHSNALHKDGREIPVELSIASGRRGYDRVFTAVIRDYSQQKRVLEELNDALQRLRFHIRRMPLGYVEWDRDFRVVEWNAAAEILFGYGAEDAKGQRGEFIVPPEASAAVDRVWRNLLAGDTSSHSINVNMRKDGTRLVCEWFNTPLRDSAGEIRGVVSMVRDVSEREALESRIRDAQKLESLGVLASGIAHDFNSSLMVILGNADLLRSVKGLPERAVECVGVIVDAGLRASQLVKHLLAYARTGRHNPQSTDLNAVIHDSLHFVQSTLGMRHELQLKLTEGLPIVIADKSQVEQVLLNLCLNAKQAMPAGGPILATTRCTTLRASDILHCVPYDASPGDYVELSVSDDGIGMDAATIRRIFDPFFTTKTDGHGLGLAAVLGILRQHAGAAWVESKVGKGTTIRTFWPISKSGDH